MSYHGGQRYSPEPCRGRRERAQTLFTGAQIELQFFGLGDVRKQSGKLAQFWTEYSHPNPSIPQGERFSPANRRGVVMQLPWMRHNVYLVV